MIGDFNDRRIVFGNWYSNIDTETIFSTPNEWIDLSISFSDTDLVNNVSYTNDTSKIEFDTAGTYLIQLRCTYSGGINEEYSLKFVNHNDQDIPNSQINFSTKGTDMWEVQNEMIIDFKPYNIDDNGFGSTKFNLKARVLNKNNTNVLVCKNASLVVVKII
jgi:hypothetical protein